MNSKIKKLCQILSQYKDFKEETVVDQIIKFLSIGVIITQFAFYAFPAELVWAEFSDISHSVYMSKWYKTRPQVQKTVLFIIAKSQRTEYFSAAGFLDINLDAFGSVVRKTFSFYALIRNVLGK